MQGYPCKICGDFPVNSQLITCKSYILFNTISTCVPKVRNYGDSRQRVIPTVITCLLWGTPCDTGFSYTFYRGNICSVPFFQSCWVFPLKLVVGGLNLCAHTMDCCWVLKSEMLSPTHVHQEDLAKKL